VNVDSWNPCDFHPWLVGAGMAPRAWTVLHGRDYLPPPWTRSGSIPVSAGTGLVATVVRTLRATGAVFTAGCLRRGVAIACSSGDPLPVRLVVSP
jgi:hypothetical protein